MQLIAVLRRFRPSYRSPLFFILWATLCTAAVVTLFLFPGSSWFLVNFTCLGAFAGHHSADLDRGRAKVVIGLIVAAALIVIVVGVFFLPRGGVSDSTAIPRWFQLAVAVAWATILGIESRHFYGVRRQRDGQTRIEHP